MSILRKMALSAFMALVVGAVAGVVYNQPSLAASSGIAAGVCGRALSAIK
ncbi:MAG: hypothetical protein HXY43_12910 [Fischerella sp.]|jgi:hypothetical protein|nr:MULTISPECIES: hypothetical protein [unclassified Fischerella]NWF60135.1 hypothetical protein [Fischerella sp.]